MDKITLSHGSGGKHTQELIQDLFVEKFDNTVLRKQEDGALLEGGNSDIVYTTDSYVIQPLFFPGGNIGKLSLTGTINDLAVMGAQPKWISCGLIIQEGLEMSKLEKIVTSMAETAEEEEVQIVTGDTKVVEQSSCDGLYINTSGIGYLMQNYNTGKRPIEIGDKILVNGYIGDHAAAMISARENFNINIDIESDCSSLSPIIEKLVNSPIEIKYMRDITRGGLATVLNEIIQDKKFGIGLRRNQIPIRDKVRGLCEPLGYDPLYFANEGKFVMIVKEEEAEQALKIMKNTIKGKNAAIIGQVTKDLGGKVTIETEIGSTRILNMLNEELVPRIC